ncbi:MAG: membrane dipeptidase [Sinobacteraceae bacterium]|nr:membrane dipeptidase [Nevskiaceae bacterium]
MKRRDLLTASALAGGALLTSRAYAHVGEPGAELRYWDNHTGFGYEGPQDVALLDHWRKAGAHYVCVNVGFDMMPWSTTILAIADYTKAIEARSDLRLCATLADVRAAWRAGQMAVTFNIEGMGALNENLRMVELYYKLGIRQMLIAYNANNAAGGGCHDKDEGLTDFGRAVIREMNRVGMVVDCAHSGIRSSLEAMRLSDKPCIFSHANVRALRDHERNITDEQIKAVAATGGVVGINGLNLYLGEGPATVEGVVRHIDYIAKLVGTAHVGVALDSDPSGWTAPPAESLTPEMAALFEKYWPARQYPSSVKDDFLQPKALPLIAHRLSAMRYAEKDVRAIMGGNFMRIASQVWAPSRVVGQEAP